MDVDPVAVVPAANADGLRRALLDTIARGNAVVPNPSEDKWPPPVLLKYAGARTWSAFARGASQWSIEGVDGNYQIVGFREHPKGYWVEDPERKIDFPTNSPVADLIDRMIAILQDAARK